MANQLFRETQSNNLINQFNTFQQNPMQFLAQKNLNIPNQYANDPQGAVQYLLNSGKMNQQTLNGLIQVANRMGIKM